MLALLAAACGPDAPPGPDARGPAGTVCNAAGWCWERPVPQGNSLAAATMLDGELWACGMDGAVLRGTEAGWSGWAALAEADLHDVWGTGAGDVWVVGNSGTVLHREGTAWTRVDTGFYDTLEGVHGSGGGDVWIAGGRRLVRWRAGRLQPVALPPGVERLGAVRARSEREAWVVAAGGVLHVLDDGVTEEALPPGAEDVRALAFDGDDLLATASLRDETGRHAALLRRRAGVWAVDHLPETSQIGGLWAGGGVVYLAGTAGRVFRFADGAWTIEGLPLAATYQAIAADASSAWAVGGAGLLARRGGDGWVQVSEGDRENLPSLWGTDRQRFVASGRGFVHTGDHRGWRAELLPDLAAMASIRGLSETDVWAAGRDGRAAHWDGKAWALVQSPVEDAFDAVWPAAPNDVWVVGGRRILHYDGATWVNHDGSPVGYALRGIGGSAPDDVWAVGDRGLVMHWDGAEWKVVHTDDATGTLRSVYAASRGAAWAAGQKVLHWDGTRWAPPAGLQLVGVAVAVHGTGPSDVWLVGTRFWHWDGKAWSSFPSGVEHAFNDVLATPGGAWAVGAARTIFSLRR